MAIQTDTALAVHEYIYNTDERHVLLPCLLLKLAISFLRIKVKNALYINKAISPALYYKDTFFIIHDTCSWDFFCYLYSKGDTKLKFSYFIARNISA